MGCTQAITISQLSVDTPLHTAVYVPATDKILGTCQNYILEFNATTGAYERAVKFMSPAYGNMHLGFINGDVYCAVHHDPSVGTTTASTQVRRDIFPVNTTTLEAGVGLGIPALNVTSGAVEWQMGPYQFTSIGNVVYALYPDRDYLRVIGFNIANPAGTLVRGTASDNRWSEQLCTDGTNVYTADSGYNQIRKFDGALNLVDTCGVGSLYPVGVEYAGGNVWAVTGGAELLKINSFGASDYTSINIAGGWGSPKPIRIRAVGSTLYMPCPYLDGIVVYVIGGGGVVSFLPDYESPIDIVSTGSKVFAVQSSATGLKEIL